ncbi:hypothetical protein EOPP23_17045 [Endozoicomonas sp. OPT23]|uniref:hypothetical protein n=1 Tax=Endozoicomonas sp. OPT23 TaxID=2072845 RepID=UPI00129A1F62|nr:hypothetical protein [Endozoicomonas sp. OPT23]MRI34692.1 hypothetical protein [Endozoicomonas sp. OPT23]
MSIKTRLQFIAPKYSELVGELKKRYKAAQPVKALFRGIDRMVQRMKSGFRYVGGKANDLAYQIPRPKITFRRAVHAQVESMMFDKSYKGKCKEGVFVTDKDMMDVIKLHSGEINSTQVTLGEGERQSVGLKVTKVRRKAGAKLDKDFKVATDKLVKAQRAYERSIASSKSTDTQNEELEDKLIDAGKELNTVSQERDKLRSLTMMVRKQALVEKSTSLAAAKDAIRIEHAVDSFAAADMHNIHGEIAKSGARVVKAAERRESEATAKEAKFKAQLHDVFTRSIEGTDVYKSQIDHFQRRQAVWGTDQLHTLSSKMGGFEQRLPGLDYYMSHAYENRKNKNIFPTTPTKDDIKLQAFKSMHEDLSELMPAIDATMAEIRVDEDKENGISRSFDMDRLEEFQRLTALKNVHKEFGEMLAQKPTDDEDVDLIKKTMEDITGSFGEYLGFGYHPGSDMPTLHKESSEKYKHMDWKLLKDIKGVVSSETDEKE